MSQGLTKDEWNEVMELFHRLWGQASSREYNKPVWNTLGELLSRLRARSAHPTKRIDTLRDLHIVRRWDCYTGWSDETLPVSKAEADRVWNERTDNGTQSAKPSDGDYYQIFPANTEMLISS